MLPSNSNGPIDTPLRAPSPVHNFGTLAVHAGSPHDPTTGAVIESVRPSVALCIRRHLAKYTHSDLPLNHLCTDSSGGTCGRVRVHEELESEPVNQDLIQALCVASD